MHKLRIIPWLFGVGLVLTTLVGANRLLHNDPGSAAGGGGALKAAPQPPVAGESLVAKGTVVSDPPPVAYGLPAHMSAGNVVEVFIHNGQNVKAGDPLVRFDDVMLKHDLKKAEDSYNAAAQDYNLAVQNHKDHAFTMEKARLAVEHAKQQRDRGKEGMAQARKDLESVLKVSRDKVDVPLTAPEIERRISEDLRIITLVAQNEALEIDVRKTEIDLKKAEAGDESLQIIVRKAAHFATAIKHDVDKIKQAIEDCTVKAKLGGTIELVTAAPGQTVNPALRTPLFYLVPSGTRLVSAEVVPDFAHKLNNRIGQVVTITDDSNRNLSYKGTVKRIGSAFLPKANGAPDMINGKSNAVLIVEIEVTDATPAGQPPLRVGQPVRVTLP